MKPRSVDEWRVVLDLIDAFLKRLREADSEGRLRMLEEGQQPRPADAAQGWQPIESAPRDGTSILVHNNIALGCPGGVADECWAANTDVAAWWKEEDGGDGDWICYMSAVQDPSLHFNPTHWQPLPLPPKPVEGM